ncbi:MAG: SDR family oxidoreductase, partial [Bacteroidales bacterium]
EAAGGFLSMTNISVVKNIFQINYFAQVLITQYVSKLMSRARRGAIVNISSIMGIDAMAGGTAYGASKAAGILFTKSLAKELAPFNIRVNAIAPNLIRTDMAMQMEEKSYQSMIEMSALKRSGTPEEVAKTILFLVSEDASYITGQVIRIDGGI